MIGIDFGTTNGAVAMADELGQVTTARCTLSHVRVARHLPLHS
jgi:molecular chaperone DnaK (HSP70)